MMTQHGKPQLYSLRTMAGWDVVEAYCGAQAIESATQHQPDAILLDVMMPAMDGPAMLAKLRSMRATSHIPIVLLTAKVQAVQNGSLSHLARRRHFAQAI